MRVISWCRAVLIVCSLSVAGVASAATFLWDRNSEPDMKDYQVWACFTPSCVVIKAPGMLQPGTINQPAVGVVPQYILDTTNKVGFVAVSARDLTLNESPLSVSVPFDALAPGAPVNPRFQ